MGLLRRGIAIVALLAQLTCGMVGTYAALGDSYAAGDGAGSSRWLPHLDATCGRFSGAYPARIARNSSLEIHHVRNVACAGATTKSILYKQMLYLWGADLVTIQVGGNEVDFFPVLNECIQQWRPFSTCDREVHRARSLIQSTHFVQAFDDMVRHATTKVRVGSRVLVLGYAKFFNAATEQCNRVSFSKTNSVQVLSNKLRASVNELVVMLNIVIEASARAHGATYIDVDTLFEGHRFCEEGVEEPHPDWEGTWFFREASSCAEAEEMISPPTDARRVGHDQSQLMLPDILKKFSDLTRTFHPTLQGHLAIAQHISDVVARHNTRLTTSKEAQ